MTSKSTSDGVLQTIRISTDKEGGERAVTAQVFGNYAVHLQQVNRAAGRNLGYTLTHVPSGLMVWKVERYEDAITCARWLHKNQPLPSLHATSLSTWCEKHRDLTNKMVAALRKIAPRWDAATGQEVPE